MKLQVIKDSKGKATGVYIPIEKWRALKRKHMALADLERKEPSKEQILRELSEALAELKLIELGKLKARRAKALLREL